MPLHGGSLWTSILSFSAGQNLGCHTQMEETIRHRSDDDVHGKEHVCFSLRPTVTFLHFPNIVVSTLIIPWFFHKTFHCVCVFFACMA